MSLLIFKLSVLISINATECCVALLNATIVYPRTTAIQEAFVLYCFLLLKK